MPATIAPTLVEREREISALAAALDDAAAGHGRTVAVVGEPGIGKSRLLAAAREHARATGMLVCSARGAELEREFPFGAVRQLAASSFADTTRQERAAWFAGVARMAAPLFREEAIAGEADASYPRLHALYWLCANASRRRPLVLLMDDAHWADDASLAFAGFLARRVAELPLALVLGARPPEPGGAAELARMLADPETATLTPGPLSAGGAAVLLHAMLGREADPAFAAACREQTGGNPFLLGELAAEVRAQGIEPDSASAPRVASLSPAGVRTTALLRLARLSEPARRLARTIALLGDRAALPVCAELADLGEPDALAAALELEEAGLVVREDGLGFVHPLLRAAITADIPTVEQVSGHAAAARALERHGAEPDAVAVHLLRAEPAGYAWVIATLRAAARRALELGDDEAAVRYLRRALAEVGQNGERAALLLELGLAEARVDTDAGVARLREAAGAPGASAEATRQLARQLNRLGRAGEAADALEATSRGPAGRAAEVPNGHAGLLQAELLATAYVRVSARRRLDPLIRALREPDGPPTTPLEIAKTAALAVEHAVTLGDPARGAELARRVAGFEHHIPVGLALLAAEWFDEAEAADPGLRALVRLRRDDLPGAEADALARLDAPEPLADAAAVAVLAGIELGRAPADLERLLEAHPSDPDYPSHSLFLLAGGALRELAGDLEGALERYAGVVWGRDCPSLYPWRSAAAVVLTRLGRDGAALAAEELRLASTPRARAVALLALGELDAAIAALAGMPVQLARALLARGAARRRAGRRTEAREDLQRAHDLASGRGAVRIAEAAADELRSSGLKLRRAPARGADALTPSERRVAELAATGLSNRDIAQSLFLSEKTVEAHLGRAYKKLGIRSRGRLAAALGGGRRAA
jgi:DNA-binding NarL/FixJ family response regulator